MCKNDADTCTCVFTCPLVYGTIGALFFKESQLTSDSLKTKTRANQRIRRRENITVPNSLIMTKKPNAENFKLKHV